MDAYEVFAKDMEMDSEVSPYGDAPANDREVKELALKVVQEDIDAAKKSNDAMSGRRSELYDLYRSKADQEVEEDHPGRSRIVSSDVMDTIEWMMPSFIKAFAGSNNAISVSPTGEEDVEKAEKNEKLLNWQFLTRCRGFLVLYELIKAGLVYGTSYAKITWREDFVRKGFDLPEVLEPEMQEMIADKTVESITAGSVEEGPPPGMMMPGMPPAGMGMPGMPPAGMGMPPAPMLNAQSYGYPPAQMESVRVYRDVQGEKRIVTYSGPRVDVIPPEDMLIDPDAKSIEDALYVIHRVKRTVSYLRSKEKEGIYTGIEKVIRHVSSDASMRSSEESSRYARAEDATVFSGEGQNQSQIARRKVEVYEWWGLLDIKGDGVAEPYLIVVAGDTIIRMERNPYAHGNAPFVELRPILDIFRFSGIGMAELVGEFQNVKTALMRQMLDNLSFQNNQMWEVDENAGVDVDSLMRPRPGGIVFTNLLGRGFKAITPPSTQAYPLQMMEFVQGMLEQRSGVTRYNQGLDASSLNKTATGISAIMGASSQRIELIARIMSESVRRIYSMMLELNQQFIDQDLVVRIFNEPLHISPDDIAGNFDVSVDIGGATGKEDQQVQQLLSMMQYATMLLQLGVMRPDNIYQIVNKVTEVWGWKDQKKYLSDPQETEKIRQIMSMMEGLFQSIQSGQIPDLQQITDGMVQAYQTLASITGVGAQEGMGSNAGESPAEGESAGGSAPTRILDPHSRQGIDNQSIPREDRSGGAEEGRRVLPM